MTPISFKSLIRDEKIINVTSSRRYFFFTRAKFDANNELFKKNLVKYKGKRTSQDVVFIVFSSLSLLVFLFFAEINFAQTACGTQIDEATAEHLRSQLGDVNQFIQENAALKNTANYIMPIQIHIVRQSNSTGGITAAQANQSIVQLNADFVGAGIEFLQCAAINYIDSDTYYNFEQAEEQSITDIHNVEGSINLYYFNQVKIDNNGTLSDICGYAYLPIGLDHLMLRNSCILSSNTLSHEMGHYFGLLHPHDTRYGEEAITRNANDPCYNCESTGDLLCDTQASPSLFGVVDSNCDYTDGMVGTCSGNVYIPDTDNTMSYTTNTCSTTFTAEQNSRMAYYAFQRSYTGCISASCPAPTNLSESNNTGTAITLSWTPAASGISEIRYRISGANWTYGGAAVSPLDLTEITQGYQYEYSIRTRCADMEVSEWVDGSFVSVPTAGAGCSTPSSWGSFNEAETAYGIVWTVMAGATGYNLRYRKGGTNDAWNVAIETNNYTLLTGLEAGTQYEFQLETICDSDNSGYTSSVYFTTLGDGLVDVQLKVFLEGALSDPADASQFLSTMQVTLNNLGLLPGQTPTSNIVDPTPAGQPYLAAPWMYNGEEGAGWDDRAYEDFAVLHGAKVVDWVLVTFRTGLLASTNFAKAAAVVLEDGRVLFPDTSPLTTAYPASFYVMIEHRNHIGVLTPTAITVSNRIAAHDFTIANSYGGNGQKELEPDVWGMFAGEAEQNLQGFDINGDDKGLWSVENGNFGVYTVGDFNMNGDANGSDKNYWSVNNGVSSNLSRE